MKKMLAVLLCLASSLSAEGFDRTKYYGEMIKEGSKNIVVENKAQIGKDHYANYVLVKVKGIKIPADNKVARVRIALWDNQDTHAVEGKAPYRAASYWAKDATAGELEFKIGVEPNKSYSYFAHVDEQNTGEIKKVLGFPTEPYVFSNTKNQGKGEGVKRIGLVGKPKFKHTEVKYTGPGQVIELNL